MPSKLLVGTRKGAWVLDAATGRLSEPIYFGNIVNHWVADPRNRSHWVMAAKAGHLGHTVYVSRDAGATWAESTQPPAFPKKADASGRAVDHVFFIAPGHASEPGVWFAGTSPQGLFRSEDGGMTWGQVDGFNEHPMFPKWTAGDAPPDGARLHSIEIDRRDARHMLVGLSGGGVFESNDGGRDWHPLNRGCDAEFLPAEAEYGHDPHCVRFHPANPDRIYQQNHCGIYRMDRPSNEWIRIGRNMPPEVGDIGFPIVVHPTDPDTAWVFPMDGTSVWPRTSPGGKPAVYRTRDAGATWERQDRGLPEANGWFTVYRQSMTLAPPERLYFGTTSGEVWGSEDGGANWRQIAAHLPRIQSVEWAG